MAETLTMLAEPIWINWGNTMRAFAIASLALCLFAEAASAQAIRFRCEFRSQATPKGVETIRLFQLEFTIDRTTGKAVLVGNAGMEPVSLVRGSSGFTFLEQLGTGVVQTTTVTLQSGSAVHSRHTIIGNELVPAQMYGQCKSV